MIAKKLFQQLKNFCKFSSSSLVKYSREARSQIPEKELPSRQNLEKFRINLLKIWQNSGLSNCYCGWIRTFFPDAKPLIYTLLFSNPMSPFFRTFILNKKKPLFQIYPIMKFDYYFSSYGFETSAYP